jgi:hypothetical protein
MDVTDKENEEIKNCCWEGCDETGTYPAPKSSSSLRLFYWFCLKHIREYNAKWNYFAHMNEAEIINYQKNSVYVDRPTWKFGVDPKLLNEKHLKERVLRQFNKEFRTRAGYSLPEAERKALAVMDLTYPITKSDIRKKYKELAKLYHPDVTKNDKKAEDKFKKISEAYNILLKSNLF